MRTLLNTETSRYGQLEPAESARFRSGRTARAQRRIASKLRRSGPRGAAARLDPSQRFEIGQV